MSVPQDRQSARELVEFITTEHGYLNSGELAEITNPDLRRKIETALLKKDLMIGSSVITLAKNLYSSKARFVFELLQNADDNRYARARALQQSPSISFMLYRDRIVVDCNEDGFTKENLTAICTVGASSKTGAQGYIGEKGIGFKSVFMVAWKVHIQSGGLSFSFTHRPGDSGMGMISPVWEDAADKLAPPLTRMTLYLHDEAKEDGILKESIHRQFSDIQETFLLFMKNLQQVSIRWFDDSGRETSSSSYRLQYPRSLVLNLARITKTTLENEETTQTSKLFHLCIYNATDLAKNENRTYSEREQTSRAWSTSQVVLAFPLTEDETPIAEPQKLFVFMPVGSVGMKFIIQADFVTDANRQSVVADSLRNHNLIDEIAKAYLKAVIEFCEHPTLKYQWMRYLPERKQQDRGRLWVSLVDKIASRLRKTPVAFSHKSNSLHPMRQLCRLTSEFLDANDEPLLEDGSLETMLSRRYRPSDAKALMAYGVRKVSWRETKTWIINDLEQGSRSHIKSPTSSDDWHTRMANLLANPFDNDLESIADEIKDLAIIPLSSGSWVSASPVFPVYLPAVGNLGIPSKVQLRVVDKGIMNPARLALFKHMGVQPATVDKVRRSILREYRTRMANLSITLEQSKEHLDFLIKTQDLADPREREDRFEEMVLFTTTGIKVRASLNELYLVTDDPLGPWELLRKTDPGPNFDDGAPGLNRTFLHSTYLPDALEEPERTAEWCDWLYDKLDVNRVLSFEKGDFEQNALSEEAEYLQKYRPEKFLGALHSWFVNNEKTIKPELVTTLQSTKVLSRGGQMVLLEDAFFPTEKLEKRVERYVEPDADFPWLWLEPDTSICESIPRKWKALIDILEIGNQDSDLEFALKMLSTTSNFLQGENGPLSVPNETIERLLGLYQYVWSMFQEQTDRKASESTIRSFFHHDSLGLIYVPAMSSDERPSWTSAKHCVWHAPRLMTTKTVISLMWDEFLPRDFDFRHLEHFFTKVVRVAECSDSTFVDELRALKENGEDDIDAIKIWYEELNKSRLSRITSLDVDLKKLFEDEALIYAPSAQGPSWYKVSQCVWSTATRLRGKPSLNDEYEDLYDFFVELLGVKPVDLEMAIDELREAGDEGSPAEVLIDSIWTVNSLLSVSEAWPESLRATRSKVFPVWLPSGDPECLSQSDEFFVIDREPYREAFQRHVKLLKFPLAQVAELEPFLRWSRLEDRYLSRCVKEVTSFGGGSAVPLLDSQTQICNRAHALLRIAKQHGSPRLNNSSDEQAFYELLRKTRILGTNDISSDIQIQQDGRTYTERGKLNAVFIREHESQLQVYIPQRKKEQTQAFKIKLPRRFLEWMMTDPDTQMREAISDKSVAATEHVFNAPLSMLKETLEEDGIAEIDFENCDDPLGDDTDAESTAGIDADLAVPGQADFVAATADSGLMTQDEDGPGYLEDDDDASAFSVEGMDTPSSVTTASYRQVANASSQPTTVAVRTRPFLISQTPTATPTIPPSVPSNDTEYSDLLDYVIRAARGALFPERSEHGLVGFRLPGNSRSVNISASSRFERNCKVGAAGELFVFELLSNLAEQHDALPGFTRDNWKSRVRELARAHQYYADLEPWYGVETSDIVYSDAAGIFTTLLREKGYFEDLWRPSMERPNYFIEVKTTTSDCAEPFYVNRSQYGLMENSALVPWNGTDLYIIFRIYNLGRDNMGLRIYLDPYRLQERGDLVFREERWSVTPRNV